jgi:tetratricopeptide (TPR) repeat protein
MKNTTTTLVVALTLGVCAFSVSEVSAEKADPRAQKAGSYYHQGTVAMKDGKFDLAQRYFHEVLKIYPSHPQAKRQLLYIQANRNKLEVKKRQGSLGKVMIPKVDMDQVSVRESLEIFTAYVAGASEKKVNPSVIVQDPKGVFKGKTVTLNLHKVPANTLLRYILDQAGGVARFDAHAIVITPR